MVTVNDGFSPSLFDSRVSWRLKMDAIGSMVLEVGSDCRRNRRGQRSRGMELCVRFFF